MARPICAICARSIEYGESYYITHPAGEPPYDYVHVACLEKAKRRAEREARKKAAAA